MLPSAKWTTIYNFMIRQRYCCSVSLLAPSSVSLCSKLFSGTSLFYFLNLTSPLEFIEMYRLSLKSNQHHLNSDRFHTECSLELVLEGNYVVRLFSAQDIKPNAVNHGFSSSLDWSVTMSGPFFVATFEGLRRVSNMSHPCWTWVQAINHLIVNSTARGNNRRMFCRASLMVRRPEWEALSVFKISSKHVWHCRPPEMSLIALLLQVGAEAKWSDKTLHGSNTGLNGVLLDEIYDHRVILGLRALAFGWPWARGKQFSPSSSIRFLYQSLSVWRRIHIPSDVSFCFKYCPRKGGE
jgi:hypothetical protein